VSILLGIKIRLFQVLSGKPQEEAAGVEPSEKQYTVVAINPKK
jgi:hypothetical protein